MSKKKKRSTPAAAPAEPAKAEHTQPEEPAVSSTARWMGALCYLSIFDFNSRLHQMAAG